MEFETTFNDTSLSSISKFIDRHMTIVNTFYNDDALIFIYYSNIACNIVDVLTNFDALNTPKIYKIIVIKLNFKLFILSHLNRKHNHHLSDRVKLSDDKRIFDLI